MHILKLVGCGGLMAVVTAAGGLFALSLSSPAPTPTLAAAVTESPTPEFTETATETPTVVAVATMTATATRVLQPPPVVAGRQPAAYGGGPCANLGAKVAFKNTTELILCWVTGLVGPALEWQGEIRVDKVPVNLISRAIMGWLDCGRSSSIYPAGWIVVDPTTIQAYLPRWLKEGYTPPNGCKLIYLQYILPASGEVRIVVPAKAVDGTVWPDSATVLRNGGHVVGLERTLDQGGLGCGNPVILIPPQATPTPTITVTGTPPTATTVPPTNTLPGVTPTNTSPPPTSTRTPTQPILVPTVVPTATPTCCINTPVGPPPPIQTPNPSSTPNPPAPPPPPPTAPYTPIPVPPVTPTKSR